MEESGAGSVVAVLTICGFAIVGAFCFVRAIQRAIAKRLDLIKDYRRLRQMDDELSVAHEANFMEAFDALSKFDTKEADRLLARRIEIVRESKAMPDVL